MIPALALHFHDQIQSVTSAKNWAWVHATKMRGPTPIWEGIYVVLTISICQFGV